MRQRRNKLLRQCRINKKNAVSLPNEIAKNDFKTKIHTTKQFGINSLGFAISNDSIFKIQQNDRQQKF